MSNLTADKIKGATAEITDIFELGTVLHDDVALTVLAALRECAERREGCEYCTPGPNERLEIQCSRIGRTSWPDFETAGRIDGHALFCPKCGRKLERSDT